MKFDEVNDAMNDTRVPYHSVYIRVAPNEIAFFYPPTLQSIGQSNVTKLKGKRESESERRLGQSLSR